MAQVLGFGFLVSGVAVIIAVIAAASRLGLHSGLLVGLGVTGYLWRTSVLQADVPMAAGTRAGTRCRPGPGPNSSR
jgi:hypothetical protein